MDSITLTRHHLEILDLELKAVTNEDGLSSLSSVGDSTLSRVSRTPRLGPGFWARDGQRGGLSGKHV